MIYHQLCVEKSFLVALKLKLEANFYSHTHLGPYKRVRGEGTGRGYGARVRGEISDPSLLLHPWEGCNPTTAISRR